MQYAEAFAALGYQLPAPRTDWTAAGEHGICISLWQKLIQEDGHVYPWYDSKLHAPDPSTWKDKPGNCKRIDHIRTALTRYGGLVDVVIVNGVPGESYKDAHPWVPEKRRGFVWRVTEFDDDDVGHFRAKALRGA
jgi:hypothetical protein